MEVDWLGSDWTGWVWIGWDEMRWDAWSLLTCRLQLCTRTPYRVPRTVGWDGMMETGSFSFYALFGWLVFYYCGIFSWCIGRVASIFRGEGEKLDFSITTVSWARNPFILPSIFTPLRTYYTRINPQERFDLSNFFHFISNNQSGCARSM